MDKNWGGKTFAWKIQQFQVITALYHFIINEQKCALIFGILKKLIRKNPLTSSFFRGFFGVVFCSCGLGVVFSAMIYLGLCQQCLTSTVSWGRGEYLCWVSELTSYCSSVRHWAFWFFSKDLIGIALPFCPLLGLVLSTQCLLGSHQLQNVL